MEIFGFVILPLALAVLALLLPSAGWSERLRPILLPLAAGVHLIVSAQAIFKPTTVILDDWLALDPLGKIVLIAVSTVFFCSFIYVPHYLRLHSENKNRVFCTSLLIMLAMVTLVILAQHFVLLWVSLEATTLSAVLPLYYNRTARSLEAAWKYMIVCSVGISLALLGTFFLAYSSLKVGGSDSIPTATLYFNDLKFSAVLLSKSWLRAAFVTMIVGYGTKLGLAPMHTWKPDAYGEAPGVVGALMAGGVTSCAFLAIARCVSIMHLAGEFEFASRILIGFGVLSMIVAAIFMVGQNNFKRMLAYSSVEHMGLLVIGLGIGGLGTFAALFHLINNAAAKGVLFISAANIQRTYASKLIDQVRGARELLPVSSAFFVLGFVAITGSPPFAPFMSEFTLLRAAFGAGHVWLAVLILVLLLVVFVGMATTVLGVIQGVPPERFHDKPIKERFLAVLPLFILMALVLLLGVYMPESLSRLLTEAATFVERVR